MILVRLSQVTQILSGNNCWVASLVRLPFEEITKILKLAILEKPVSAGNFGVVSMQACRPESETASAGRLGLILAEALEKPECQQPHRPESETASAGHLGVI